MVEKRTGETNIDLAGLVAHIGAGAGHARRLIAVAGPPGVGKSTFAAALCDALNEIRTGLAEVLPMDGYHFDDMLLEARGLRARKGAPNTFDVDGLRAMLERLRRNTEAEVVVPVFDRSIEIARAGARAIPQTTRIVIVEGNYLLLADPPWSALASFFDLSVKLVAPLEVIAQRLEARWVHYGLDPAARAEKLDGNDLPNVRTVLDRSGPADFVIGR